MMMMVFLMLDVRMMIMMLDYADDANDAKDG